MTDRDYPHADNPLQPAEPFARQIIERWFGFPPRKATLAEDRDRATDLVVERPGSLDNFDIALRLRSHQAFRLWPSQFTVRVGIHGRTAPAGYVSELDKIMGGCGDFMFHGFCHANPAQGFALWRLLDMKAFRVGISGGIKPISRRPTINTDMAGKTFLTYRFRDFPEGFVVTGGSTPLLSHAPSAYLDA